MKLLEIIQMIVLGIILALGFIALVVISIKSQIDLNKRKKEKSKNINIVLNEIQKYPSYENINYNNYKQAYEPKYLMSLNEKYQFNTINNWARKKGLIVFTKVRLLDLIQPRNMQGSNQHLLWKIQAKHVDFVICDQNINVKCIIEINDGSHFAQDRIDRDIFVRDVLQACGYTIIQTFAIDETQLDAACGYGLTLEGGQQ